MSIAIKAAKMGSMGGMAGRVRSGDPGLGGFLKGLGKGILGGVTGLVTGGPLGAVGGIIGGISGGGGGGSKLSSLPTFQPTGPGPGVVPTPGPGGFLSRITPGGSTGYQPSGAPPKGYRLNKSGYFLKDGTYVAPETRYVKIRRRNSMNPRALSRSIARVNGAKRIQHTLSEISTGKYTGAGKLKVG